MVRYIESDCRVFRVSWRKRRGTTRWRFRAEQVSGPPLSVEDWDWIVGKLVAEAVACGAKNIRWTTGGSGRP